MKTFSTVVTIKAKNQAQASKIRSEMFAAYENLRDGSQAARETDVDMPKVIDRDLAEILAKYRALHNGISDMIEEGRLKEADIPDDYKWLVTRMIDLAGIDHNKGTTDVCVPQFDDLKGLEHVELEGAPDDKMRM